MDFDRVHTRKGNGSGLGMADDEALAAGALGDDLLATRCSEGDQRAFGVLVERHLPRLMALSRRMLGQEQEAEDVAQEALLKLWRHAGDYDPERAKLSTWLYRVTSNLCIDRLRGRRDVPLENAPEQVLTASQDDSVLADQRAYRVDLALRALPERQRLAVVLFHYQELSLNETAEVLDCSGEAVESLLARGRRNLKSALEAEWRQYMPDSDK